METCSHKSVGSSPAGLNAIVDSVLSFGEGVEFLTIPRCFVWLDTWIEESFMDHEEHVFQYSCWMTYCKVVRPYFLWMKILPFTFREDYQLTQHLLQLIWIMGSQVNIICTCWSTNIQGVQE